MDWSIHLHVNEDDEFRRETDNLIQTAWNLVPKIREHAQEASVLRRVPDVVIEDADVFWPALVPKTWGGRGLGARALCEVARVLAHGDASVAWSIAFIMEHSWMACHLPWAAQKELFAERPYILASAPLQPGGKAVRSEGGYLVNGTFRYASGVGNSDWTFGTAMVEENGEAVPYTFLLPLDQPGVTVNDDWFMAGMAGTSSASITVNDVFVPERRSLKTELFNSADLHAGTEHKETFLRYPQIATVTVMIAAIALGTAEASTEMAVDRLQLSKMFNIRRLDLPISRVRWGTAHQKVRCARLLYQDLLGRLIAKCDAAEVWSEQDAGQVELDLTMIVSLAQDAVQTICSGLGTSIYRLDDPLQRQKRDLDVIASHVALDKDIVNERGSRLLLGLGFHPNEPAMLRSLVGRNEKALPG